MEPAVYRREHHHRLAAAVQRQRVAMEPAVYRREHVPDELAGHVESCVSQWSPPFIGGSTGNRMARPPWNIWSQWSPPFIGGSTDSVHRLAPEEDHVAMEPAVYRREHARGPGPGEDRSPGRNGARRL